MKKALTGISAAALAAGLGLGIGQLASADDPTPTPSPTATASAQVTDPANNSPKRNDDWGPRHDNRGVGTNLADLAEKLGVDTDDLAKAMDDAMETVRDGMERPNTPQDDETRAEHQAAVAKAVADELGLEENTVLAAMQELESERQATRAAAEKAVLDQAVDDGTLTQAEADAVQKAADEGIVTVRGQGMGGGHGFGNGRGR